MRILDVQQKSDHPHVKLYKATYQDKTGKKRSWMFASRKKVPTALEKENTPDAVVIVPYHLEEEKLVIIREYRVPLGGMQYGFPAGLVDADETIETTAARELYEETGLRLVRILRQSPLIYSSSGLTDESLVLVFAECRGRPTSRHTGDAEDIAVIMLTQKAAIALRENPDLSFDVKSWLVLDTFAETGRIV
ncbi:MAG: NUDIX hydrolase [Desulfosudaceae bacterium]